MSVQKSNGLTKAENMISDITSMILFLIHGDVLFPLAIGAAITNIAGNYFGAKFFEKKRCFCDPSYYDCGHKLVYSKGRL